MYNMLSLPLQRRTLFEAAFCKWGRELVVKMEGVALLQYVSDQPGYEPIINLLKGWGVDVSKRSERHNVQHGGIQGTTSQFAEYAFVVMSVTTWWKESD